MVTYTLNLLDLLLTLHALGHGAEELNPLMRDIPTMIFCKVVVVGILCRWLGTREEAVARNGLKFLTAAFGAVDVWHIVNIIRGGIFLWQK